MKREYKKKIFVFESVLNLYVPKMNESLVGME